MMTVKENQENQNLFHSIYNIFLNLLNYTDELSFKRFFKIFFNSEINYLRFANLTESEKKKLDKLYEISDKAFLNSDYYSLVNLEDYKVYSDFELKNLNGNYVFRLPDYNREFVYNFIKKKEFYNICEHFYCTKINNNYLISTKIIEDMENNFKDYFALLPKKIIQNELNKNILVLRIIISYIDFYKKHFITFYTENLEKLKKFAPKYKFYLKTHDINKIYEFIDLINKNLRNFNYDYKQISIKNTIEIYYYIELSYNYKDLVDFIRNSSISKIYI